jgi:hypothetical protein
MNKFKAMAIGEKRALEAHESLKQIPRTVDLSKGNDTNTDSAIFEDASGSIIFTKDDGGVGVDTIINFHKIDDLDMLVAKLMGLRSHMFKKQKEKYNEFK